MAEAGPYRALFSCRRSGNLGYHTGDDPAAVTRHRQGWLPLLGPAGAAAVAAQQVHGCQVTAVDAETAGRGLWTHADAIPGSDGLTTTTPELPLLSLHADCLPVYLVDRRQPVIGLGHAGWRGTAQGVAAALVRTMEQAHGSWPGDLLAVIGPGIGPCCYQVDRPVHAGVAAAVPSPEACLVPDGPHHWRLDLAEANRQILVQAGVPAAAISVTGLCTACREDLFFSYRREGPAAGRMLAALVIERSAQ